MLRKITLAVCLAAVLVTAGGCDAFRRLAGRPTSAEIAAKRELILQEEAAHQARLDSLKLIEEAMADSLRLVDSITALPSSIIPAGEVRGLMVSGLNCRYYVVVGAFSKESNIAKMQGLAAEKGYVTVRIPFDNGFTAVGICGTDVLSEAYASLRRVKAEDFCPEDVWVLVNE
ncbi:MAG: hypothetical protein J5771_00225 [Bacteroidales bacterium]|nr:hypothetical protein [Bacteroidales bacterium]